MPPQNFRVVFSEQFTKILFKLSKKDKLTIKKLETEVIKISQNPLIGKPLRNVLKNYRRVHIDPFVLVYEIHGNEVRILDFDHHDRMYKKKF